MIENKRITYLSVEHIWKSAPFVLLLSIFIAHLIFLRLYCVNPTLGLDEAEQWVFAQQFSLGYPAQPPLYTWIQYLFFALFGVSLFTLSLFKYFLLGLSIYIFYLIAKQYNDKPYLAVMAVFSWMLIPSISLDLLMHRTHGILALCTVCLTWYWFLSPASEKSWKWYCGLGIITSAGILSKFNYIAFLVIFSLVLLSIPAYRSILLTRKIVLSALIVIVFTSPYLYWLITEPKIALSGGYKLYLPDKNVISGLFDFIKHCILFFVPVFLTCVIFYKRKDSSVLKAMSNLQQNTISSKNWVRITHSKTVLVYCYHAVALVSLILSIFLFGINTIKPHWLLPILCFTPLLIFNSDSGFLFTLKERKYYLTICLIVQLLFITTWIYRTPHLSKYPMALLLKEIEKEYYSSGQVVSTSHWLLGTVMRKFPDLSYSYLSGFEKIDHSFKKKLIIWEGDNTQLRQEIGLETQVHQIKQEGYTLNWAYIN